MTLVRSRFNGPGFRLLLIALVLAMLAPASAATAKILASEALATALANGTLEQIKQDLLMDLGQKQKYEFDEDGMEQLGRRLLAQDPQQAVEILQINQMVHQQSPAAANALGDAYRESGQDMQARIYYDMALELDPDNEHAKQATAEQGDASDMAMAAMGGMDGMDFDPSEMQAALAQAGVEMTPEQMEKMQQAQAQLEAYQQDGGALAALERQQAEERQQERQRKASAAAEPQYESEFCMVLHKYNAEKKITDTQVRERFAGNYAPPGDKLKSWNVETACDDFLIAVPLWADVSPPIMMHSSDNTFEDSMGGTWIFQLGGDGRPTAVTYTAPSDGTVSELQRMGDPISLE